MAITVLTDAKVTFNGTVLSDHVESVEINQNYDDVEITAMGAVAHAFTPGLRQDAITINYYQDFKAGGTGAVDATHFPLLGSAAGASLIVVPTSGTVSATNPSYTVVATIYTYQPLNGSVGEASMTQVEYRPAAGGFIARGTI